MSTTTSYRRDASTRVLPPGAVDTAALTDAELGRELLNAFAERRRVDARIARLSGEVAERSRASLGNEGLARRTGNSTAPSMVASLGLIGAAEARQFCAVGEATAARSSLTGEEALPPRFEAVAAALDDGKVALSAAHHIVTQLDLAGPRAAVDDLVVAEGAIVEFAAEASADDVRRLAIRWRDALDEDGIEPREEELVAARGLKRTVLPNGLKRFVLDLDPLSAAYLDTAIDAEVTAALRAVRFVDDSGAPPPGTDDAGADELGPDTRTIPQLAADAVVDLARHCLACQNTTPALAAATVVVRMSEEALVSGLGRAEIDGAEQAISAGAARRLAAEGEIIPMVLGGDGEVLDLGRSRRVFSRAQRIALAERDGGCAVRGCHRPPSHTEAHHIRWWSRDRGPTDLENGVLLCTRDHHRIHSQGWDIRVEKGAVWFIPPPTIDPTGRPRPGGRVPIPELRRSPRSASGPPAPWSASTAPESHES